MVMLAEMSLKVRRSMRKLHGRVPFVRVLPLSVISIIFVLLLVNALVWTGTGIALVRNLLIPLLR